ncbi:MAG TPA: prepilin-type N-terminal cleavage/methylation domain-containing protein [Fontimonas sp.]
MRARSSGFTLVEILVVVVIVGIMLTFATLAIDSSGDRAIEDKLVTEAERMEQLFKLGEEEAELKGIEIGFIHTSTDYAFLVVGPDGDWIPFTEGPLRPRPIPQPLAFALRVENRPVAPAQSLPEAPSDDEKKASDPSKPEVVPQVMLLSSGEITPFTLDLTTPALPVHYRLTATLLGEISKERFDREGLR